MADLKELLKRYDEIEKDISYRQRIQRERAHECYAVLQRIDDEKLQRVAKVVPAFLQIVKYSEEDILKNANGEAQTIQDAYNQLLKVFEEMLNTYGEHI